MKKLLKIVAILAVVCVVLMIAALVTLKIMFPPAKLQALAQQYASEFIHREVTFSDATINLIGVTLKDVAISEKSTFADGTFLKADKAVVKLAFLPLLTKTISISTVGLEGLSVNIISGTDGKFNFDDLMQLGGSDRPAQTTETDDTSSDGVSFSLLADHMYAKRCNIYYKDLQSGMDSSITNLNIEIRDFDLDQPFNAAIDLTGAYQDHAGMDVSVPVKIALTVDLASLDLDKAYVTLQNLSTQYKTIKVNLLGGIKNFNAPVMNLQGTISGISNTALADIMPDLPHFVLPDLSFNADASANLDQSTFVLQQAKLAVSDSNITASGKGSWGGNSPTYNIQTALHLNLSQLAAMTNLMDGFGAGGTVTGNLTATEKKDFQDVSGKLDLAGLTIQYPPVVISDVKGQITLVSLANIFSNTITGKLNGEGFTTSFAYKDLGKVLDLVFNFDLSKLVIDSFSQPAQSKNTATPTNITAAPAASNEPETLFNVRSNVKIGEIAVPYFTSEGATLTANLQNASATMSQANGTVSFQLQQGTIKDLLNLTKGNKVVDILLLPLTLIKKVTTALKVDIFPSQNSKEKGIITIQDGSGNYIFTNGIMQLQETHFNSSASNVTATGNINFKTEALDMRVTATVLTNQTPIVIKIGGTMSDPSGKLDITGTAISLVGGLLGSPAKAAGSAANTAGKAVANTGQAAGKAVADTAVSAVKSIGGLFKSKSDTKK